MYVHSGGAPGFFYTGKGAPLVGRSIMFVPSPFGSYDTKRMLVARMLVTSSERPRNASSAGATAAQQKQPVKQCSKRRCPTEGWERGGAGAGSEEAVASPAPTALLPGGRCRPQRPWGSSSLPHTKKELSLGWELPVPLPAPAALLTDGRCRPQRPWGSSSLPPYQKGGREVPPAARLG